MATIAAYCGTVHIGVTAGEVWDVLDAEGPQSFAKLVKSVGKPRDLVMQSIGWLAREEKICIDEEGRSKVISLR